MSPVERLVADHIASGTVRAEMIRELACAFADVCDGRAGADAMTHTFTVPGPPVPKQRARVVNGHAFTPAATRNAEAWVRAHARAAGVARFVGPIALTVNFCLPDRRRRDLDNLVKLVQDALNPTKKDPWGAWSDDSQIVTMETHKFYAPDNPRTVVTIASVEDAARAAVLAG